ncbi:hypothetical protein CMV00_01895 [Elizabethkingia anophelis]|nr:hypothetical protein [Elizabethkingia anophelis]
MKKIEYPLTKYQEDKFNTLFERYEFYNNSNDELKFLWQPNDLFDQEKFEVMKTMVDLILNEYGQQIKEHYHIPVHIIWSEVDMSFIYNDRILFLEVKRPKLILLIDNQLSDKAQRYWSGDNLMSLFRLLNINESLKVGNYLFFEDVDTRDLGFERDLKSDCEMPLQIESEEISFTQYTNNVIIKQPEYFIQGNSYV